MCEKVIIVGGVAGGASTATRLRRLNEDMEIIVIERGKHVSFANCGLPYYIGGIISERSNLLIETAQGMENRFNLDIRTENEVKSINTTEKTITVVDLKTQENYVENYDHLVLSPGANPLAPPIEGLREAKNVFTLRTIPDADRITEFIEANKPKKSVIIGGGFIGLEMAENLHHLGLEVTIVEMLPQVMAPIDFEMANIVHKHLVDKGINLILSDGVQSFADEGNTLKLQSGATLSSDLTILSIGVRPEVALAESANLDLGPRGGIKVNSYMQTSDPFIYALGDAVEVLDFVAEEQALIPLAGPANKQGRLVADNIAGKKRMYKGTMGTSIARVFDLTVACTGNNEKTLRQNNLPYEVIHLHGDSHVTYYPGAEEMSLKLIFHPETGRIYGAQGVGGFGLDKRIDVLATAIYGGLDVEDLQELELAYAPPYGAAKDPVNLLGFAASNLREGISDNYQWYEVPELLQENANFLDVRPVNSDETTLIPGSFRIPLEELRSRLFELPQDEPIYVFCAIGLRGYAAERILKQNGFTALNLDGGLATLKQSQY